MTVFGWLSFILRLQQTSFSKYETDDSNYAVSFNFTRIYRVNERMEITIVALKMNY